MKRSIISLLALALSLCLFGCFGSQSLITKDPDGMPCLNDERLGDVLEQVELTTENWRDYIRVYSYDVKVVKKDTFDEVINSEVATMTCLGYGTDRYYSIVDAAIELKHKTTGEILLLEWQNKPLFLESSINLDDYECTRIKGHLYFLDFPEELLETFDAGRRTSPNGYLRIGSPSMGSGCDVYCEAMFVCQEGFWWSNYFE